MVPFSPLFAPFPDKRKRNHDPEKFSLNPGGWSLSAVADFICLAKRKEVEKAANAAAIKRLGFDRWSVFVVTDLVYSAKGKRGWEPGK